jgi:negative regulator of genetic competence, sporulation and motility
MFIDPYHHALMSVIQYSKTFVCSKNKDDLLQTTNIYIYNTIKAKRQQSAQEEETNVEC